MSQAVVVIRMDAGEGKRIELRDDPPYRSTAPFDDLTGRSVRMFLEPWVGSATVDPVVGALDPPDAEGKVRSCGAYVPKTLARGTYNGTMIVGVTEDGADWPQKRRFLLIISGD